MVTVATRQMHRHTDDVPLEDYLTTDEAAAELGIKRTSILKLIEREKLTGRLVGSQWLIHRSEVDRYKRDRRSPGRPRKKRGYQRKTGD